MIRSPKVRPDYVVFHALHGLLHGLLLIEPLNKWTNYIDKRGAQQSRIKCIEFALPLMVTLALSLTLISD